VRRGGSLNLLAVVHLGHAANSSTSKARVLVAVSPAVNRSLDQAPLAAQGRVELRQSPSDAIAISLVHQSVSAILILGAASSRVDAILLLKLGGQLIGINGLNIASDRVLHLDSVARVFESNPLDAISVLSHNQRSGRGNGSWSSIRINAWRGVAWTLQLRCIGLMLGLWHG
jgi:hypothetical protein